MARAADERTATSEPPAIRVDGLEKSYGDGEDAVTAVDNVSFEIERGSVVGLLGPNGAGKTTTIKAILGLVIPDVGTVEIGGIDVRKRPRRAYDQVGAMLEGARNVYWRLTVRENLAFFAGLGGDDPAAIADRHDELLEGFGLADRADTVVNELSRGMKQKVALASTLARDVDVVFMDEPTLGLDVETSLELRSELRRLADRDDVTIVLSSHDMDVIEAVCDDVIVLDDGSIVADEAVDSLLAVFQTREYRIRVESTVPDDARRQLERAVGADCKPEGDGVAITFTAADGEDVYEAMDVLRAYDLSLREIDSSDPNLEEVFLRLTGGDVDRGETDDRPRTNERAEAPGETGPPTEG
ncbi:ABC transporter ATP-binding protein [Natrarchaeobius sp. A-rgal3]|uniref:ABC transporter ATP-binding protein n=1 Tax=Natrarchaeobius versutus TaxID=1679078 RepID=UPI00350FB7C1